MPTWTHIEIRSRAEAPDLIRALAAFRSCVVQDSMDDWSIYVQADPELIAEMAPAVRLSNCHEVDESELDPIGISRF
jgi:hypothetical protein